VEVALRILVLIYFRDVGDEFPAARVIGADLSPIQPTLVPPNCQFETDNVTFPWTYDSEQFDLIYIREMNMYHRPFQLLFAPFFESGLILDALEETNFDKSFRDPVREHSSENFTEFPKLLSFRLRRVPESWSSWDGMYMVELDESKGVKSEN
jgi:hypothetical protein